jgi:predicted transcriptional regulator
MIMSTETQSQEDLAIVTGAQNRANIMAYLNTHPGTHKAAELSEALGVHYSTAFNHLKSLAETKQIKMKKDGNTMLFSAKNGNHVTATVDDTPAKRAYKKIAKKPSNAHHKEVEFVVHGMHITIGRNEKTGRPQIIVDEVS